MMNMISLGIFSIFLDKLNFKVKPSEVVIKSELIFTIFID